jgi:hypothetical protein
MNKEFSLNDLVPTEEQIRELQARQAARAQAKRAPRTKAERRFIMVPWRWHQKLIGAHGSTYHVAQHLLYLNWKDRGAPIKLSNRAVDMSPSSKWRALRVLESRGLISVERRPNRSPLIRVLP